MKPRLPEKPEWRTRPFTWEEIREALSEAWVSWRTNGRVSGSSFEDRRDRGVPAEHRDELHFAPARLISACMWSGDPYGEPAHPEFHAKVMNTLERFRAGGLLTSEPLRNAEGGELGVDWTLYRLVTLP